MAGDAHEQLEAGRHLRLDEGTSNAAIEPGDQVCVGPAGGLSVGDVERDCAVVALVEDSLDVALDDARNADDGRPGGAFGG